jgi:hypothetical protein
MAIEPSEEPPSYLNENERQLLKRFLVLIRDNYRKADKATFFMERRAGVTNSCAVYNLRDVLSHFATFLDPGTPPEDRPDQLASAEEHLRRAIIEPYEIGLASLIERLEPLYQKYKARLLPVKDRYTALSTAPNQIQLDKVLAEVNDMVQKGKNAKANNRWDADWEAGVQALPEAYEMLASLHSEIESRWYIFEQIERDAADHLALARQNRKQTALTVWGIAATVLMGVLAIVVAYLLSTR